MPKLLWDLGTAYDLFISVEVLHNPGEYDLPGAWTAGMRARLGAAERKTLEQSTLLFHAPVHWIYTLPKPKDARTVIWSLGQVPPAERLPLLGAPPLPEAEPTVELLQSIKARGSWKERDREALRAAFAEHSKEHNKGKQAPSQADLMLTLDSWAHAADFGERYLQALQNYQDAFFAEEEKRIRPALEEALTRAQNLAKKLSFTDLIEELSQGLRMDARAPELVLAPSYWTTPLVYMSKVSARREIWIFGARPANESLVPGEAVSDAMVRALKAMSDPTRLRILQYLAEGSISPAELAKRLRLRTPTVLHHLQILRLAGLVQITMTEGKDKTYAARPEAVSATFSSLKDFLDRDKS